MASQDSGNNLDDTKREYGEIHNPYRPYDFASAKWFYHQDIIKKIKEIFAAQPDNRIILLQGKPCSGKSAILKRIEETPGLLGENYIPIYLDCSQYINLDANDLLYSVSKDIINKLNNLGYSIPMSDEIKKRQIDDSTFEALFLRFDINLESNKVLLLIFDEFDTLLENVGAEIIAQYIHLSKHIERSWDNYGLILAGDKPLLNITCSETINQFLENTCQIMTKRTADEKDIRKLITNPVKNQLTYDKDAINKIMWYSGRNLYFQQLICYYIVDHFDEKTRRLFTTENVEENHGNQSTLRCSVEDVETAVQHILTEQIPDFFYVWDRKLTIEKKLVVSALADKTITEKKGYGYLLKPGSLPDHILGNDIYKEIEELEEFGYINKMQRRYFQDSPFIVPLHGKWIEKEHPFLKVVMEHIEEIADKIDLSLMKEKVKETPSHQLAPFKKETILEIAEKWCMLNDSIRKKRKTIDSSQITTFFESFSHQLNLFLKQKPRSNENYCILDIKNMDIGILEEALCFIQDKPGFKPEDIFNIENQAGNFTRQANTRLTLLFYFQENEMVECLVKKPYLNLVSLDENDIKKIIFSEKPFECFRRITLRRLSLSKTSPYQTDGPTAIFYGRSRIINQMINSTNKSFAIIGARKIGKTSLLLKIKDNQPPDANYIFIDLQSVFPGTKSYQREEKLRKGKFLIRKIGFKSSSQYKVFLKNFVLEIRNIFKKRFYPAVPPFSNDVSRLNKVIQKLPRREKRLVFIFDEVDELIEFDRKNGYRLLRLFRSLAQANYCQFIFSGFSSLYHRKREHTNPLYNFCEEIRLEPLEKQEAVDLITRPMEKIGIHYHNQKDVDFILDYTGCHPNLVQFFCQKLVEKLDRYEDLEIRRTIFFEDIKQLFDFSYEDYIIDQVYMFSSDLDKMDQLILILLAEEHSRGNGKTFSINDIKQLLTTNGIRRFISKDNLYQTLINLVIRFILLESGKDRYSFALPIFPGILKKRIDNEFKQEIIEEINANES